MRLLLSPDQLHTIWTLPTEDAEFSTRWNMLKGHFSRSLEKSERISESRQKRGARGIWQRRFWAHAITSQEDYNQHVDYIHWNPVKHGYVKHVIDWPHSSFHQFVSQGIYPVNWGCRDEFNLDTGE
ncbi:transposase [Methylomonas sp. AM2-LC]|uniref:REP-associated tyrosine transposase n=1 Tax=Methylomonas sp. AM2-LC TaxID=3153301 RepID=UPI00326657BD